MEVEDRQIWPLGSGRHVLGFDRIWPSGQFDSNHPLHHLVLRWPCPCRSFFSPLVIYEWFCECLVGFGGVIEQHAYANDFVIAIGDSSCLFGYNMPMGIGGQSIQFTEAAFFLFVAPLLVLVVNPSSSSTDGGGSYPARARGENKSHTDWIGIGDSGVHLHVSSFFSHARMFIFFYFFLFSFRFFGKKRVFPPLF